MITDVWDRHGPGWYVEPTEGKRIEVYPYDYAGYHRVVVTTEDDELYLDPLTARRLGADLTRIADEIENRRN